MATQDSGWCQTVSIESQIAGRDSAQVLVKIAICSAEEGMGDKSAVFIVWTKPLRAANKDGLTYEWTIDMVGVDGCAGSAQVIAHIAFDTQIPGKPE